MGRIVKLQILDIAILPRSNRIVDDDTALGVDKEAYLNMVVAQNRRKVDVAMAELLSLTQAVLDMKNSCIYIHRRGIPSRSTRGYLTEILVGKNRIVVGKILACRRIICRHRAGNLRYSRKENTVVSALRNCCERCLILREEVAVLACALRKIVDAVNLRRGSCALNLCSIERKLRQRTLERKDNFLREDKVAIVSLCRIHLRRDSLDIDICARLTIHRKGCSRNGTRIANCLQLRLCHLLVENNNAILVSQLVLVGYCVELDCVGATLRQLQIHVERLTHCGIATRGEACKAIVVECVDTQFVNHALGGGQLGAGSIVRNAQLDSYGTRARHPNLLTTITTRKKEGNRCNEQECEAAVYVGISLHIFDVKIQVLHTQQTTKEPKY